MAPADHRIPEYRDHRLTDARDLRIDSNRMEQSREQQSREQQSREQQSREQQSRDGRMGVRMETPTLSYKPYEQHTSARSSAPAPSSRSTRSPSSYPLHYATGSSGPSGSHSFSPSPSGRNSTGATNMYMPPPPVSPSRSPAVPAAGHAPYPAMRYSPAPAPLPVPSTSPSAGSGGHKKSSPSPSQPAGIPYGRPPNNSAPASSVQSVSRNPESGPQTIPLSLMTPGKFLPTDSVPPPAHTARSERADVRLYPHPAYSPLSHPLPPPQPLLIQQSKVLTHSCNHSGLFRSLPVTSGVFRLLLTQETNEKWISEINSRCIRSSSRWTSVPTGRIHPFRSYLRRGSRALPAT